MKISVIMPVYNAEKHLRFSVGSVLKQTHADWELICVDDGSTDSSGRILDEFAAKDARIRVIHKANGGVSAARNAGMDVVTGDLATFLDADDTYVAHALEFLAEARTRTGADVIRFGCYHVESHDADAETPEMPGCSELDLTQSVESPLRRCSLGWATAIPAAFVRQVRWPDLTQCEDPLFVLRCLRLSSKAIWIDGKLANYLVRPDSLSHARSLSAVWATCRYLVRAYDECARFPGFSRFREDTCRFLSGFVTGPLAHCGRDMSRNNRVAAEAAVRTARNLLALRDPAFAAFACVERHDFVFTLGSSCTATEVLRRADLQYSAFPLDWIGRLGVRARTEFIIRDFRDFLSIGRLHLDETGNDGRHLRYVDTRDGTAFFHDFPVGEDLSASYPRVSEKYARRISRFRHYLEHAKSVLVVWIADFRDERDGVASADADMCASLDALERRFPGTHFSMIVFDQAVRGADPSERFVDDGRIRRVSLDYRDWQGGPESWTLQVDRLLPYLAGHRVRDYRTSSEKRAFGRKCREAEMRRFSAHGWLDLMLLKFQYRISRHLQKVLARKGIHC